MPNRPSLRRRLVAVLFCGAIAMGSVFGTGTATAAPIKECVEEDEPSQNWTTEGTQKGSCKSSHERDDETVTNPGGATPPGKQP